MDIISYIEKEHEEIQKLILDFETADSHEDKKNIFKKISAKLLVYSQAEEDVFYGLMADLNLAKKELLKSYEEHSITTSLLENLIKDAKAQINDVWIARFEVLQDLLKHHHERKRQILFPIAKQHLTEERLKELGHQYAKEAEKKEKEVVKRVYNKK